MRTLTLLAVLLVCAKDASAQSGTPPPTTAEHPAADTAPAPSPDSPAVPTDPGAPVPGEANTAPSSSAAADASAATRRDQEEESAVPDANVGSKFELSEAELESLGFVTLEEGEVAVTDRSVKVYGFMDVGLSLSVDRAAKLYFGRNANLYMGNLNLYISKQISDTVRTMAEVRFLVLPNGTADAMGGRINAMATDYQDYYRELRWGGIEIERAYLEWAAHPLLNVRAGIFLTPYGIWNVDHGSPVIVSILRPNAIGNGYLPERQTGLELSGRHELSGKEALGYHLTLSNGRGPVSEYLDLDKNKALGGRIFLETRRVGELRVGASTYYGRYSDLTIPFGSTMPTFAAQYDDLAFALDVLYKLEGFMFQAEWAHRQRAYTDKAGCKHPERSAATFRPTSRAGLRTA